jgi:membrane-bound hydrogenase subunit mbhJ
MLVGSPRHADILIITGPLSHQMESRVRLIYDLMPHPKRVVALGVCAISGGAFMGSKSVQKQLDSIIPIDLYIPGCPPHPEAIIEGLLKLISSLETPQTKSLSPKLEKGGIKSE